MPTGGAIKVPTAPGYGVLKLAAWLDRSPQHITKDASDLAVVARWYENRNDLTDELYGTDEGAEILARFDYDPGDAAVSVLARDMGNALALSRKNELRERLAVADLDSLAKYFSLDNTRVPEEQFVERRRRVGILVDI
ncbi:hypothetical protein AB2L27_13410 [Kineococcus sp. LSe6-4]|uniref:Uncharacterized protein n=1 Tax=Kineococcus halophytocola TaxID=3234027 RepID=A0ABV4H4X6_9ACTN